MKRVVKFLLVFILVLGFTACGSTKKNSGKVKVYIFYAGGCPYCANQVDYLKSLEENDVKFEIVEKELYVDHIEWQPGADYDLGVKVAKAFQEAGFNEASYQGTPFVVISDIYARSAYSPDLLDVINQAYEEGDKDIVGCLEKGDDCEVPKYLTETDKEINSLRDSNKIHFIVIYSLIGVIVLYLIITRTKKDNKKVVVKEVKEVKEEKPVEEKPKKTVKKATKKKN